MEIFETTNISGCIRITALNAAAKIHEVFGTNDQSIRLNLLKEFLAYYSTIACNEICLKLNNTGSSVVMKAFNSIRGDLGHLGLIVADGGRISEIDERLIVSLANDSAFQDNFAAYWNGDMTRLKISTLDIEHFSQLGLERPTSDPTHIASFAFQVRIFKLGRTDGGNLPTIPILSLCSSVLSTQMGIYIKALKYFIDIADYYGNRSATKAANQNSQNRARPVSQTIKETIAFLQKNGLSLELTDAYMKCIAEEIARQIHGLTMIFDSNIGDNKGSYSPTTNVVKLNPGHKTTDNAGNIIVVGRATTETPLVMLAHHVWAKMPENIRQRFSILVRSEIDALNSQRAEYNKEVSDDDQMGMIDPEHYFTSEVGCKTLVQLCTGKKGMKNWFGDTGALWRVKNGKCDLNDIYVAAIYWLINATPKGS